VRYHTTYVRQSLADRAATQQWLLQVAEDIQHCLDQDPELAQWFVTPMNMFRRTEPGDCYTPEDLITDMISQISLGRDLTEAMIRRWNRLCDHTPWHMDFEPAIQPRTAGTQAHTVWVAQ
jgi:hypothetical protein